MLLIAVAAASLAGSLPGFQQAVVECAKAHAVELARKAPQERAGDIALAADAECVGAWQQAQQIEPWSIVRPLTPTGSPAFHDIVIGEATRAVIEDRAK